MCRNDPTPLTQRQIQEEERDEELRFLKHLIDGKAVTQGVGNGCKDSVEFEEPYSWKPTYVGSDFLDYPDAGLIKRLYDKEFIEYDVVDHESGRQRIYKITQAGRDYSSTEKP